MAESRNNLGRGLAALFGEDGDDYTALDKVRTAKDVPIEQIHPNPNQPRQTFDDTTVEELAQSIKQNGILQPLLVRRHPDRPQEFEIVAGERRWRAAQLAQLHEVPVVIRDIDEGKMLEMALVENVQREDLNVLEEAEAYHRLTEEFGHKQEVVAEAVGKSRSHVANTLRLLSLSDSIRALIADGRISAGHGRALLKSKDPESLARQITEQGLNVRQAEQIAKGGDGAAAKKASPAPAAPSAKDPDTLALERDLSSLLGMKVTISIRGAGGTFAVHYQSVEQLDDLLRRLDHAG